jgi:ATP-dependent exoDNAse (exonuclease V) alpha subunit
MRYNDVAMTQDEALNILKTGINVFLTGEPGSGKTYLVNRYVEYLREHGIIPAITASTGIAATHIGGMTIHSWSGVGIKNQITQYDLRRIEDNPRTGRKIKNANILIIDEISMLSARMFSMVDEVCRAVRGSDEAFGGLQVVLVGDFFQLPPVVRRASDLEERLPFENESDDPSSAFAYQSPAWRDLGLTVCYLSEQYRQEDAAFLDILSALRSGSLTDDHKERLLARGAVFNEIPKGVTKLFPHNADVDRVNERELGNLLGAVHVFTMQGSGQAHLIEQLKRGCLSPEKLQLKIGAKVMFTKNNFEGKFVNGTTGTIVGFRADDIPIVETRAGKRVAAEPADWKIEIEMETLASVRQVPLRLAWAITVHKSQGMSLDAAIIDLGNAFEYGQGYVALSRVRTLAGLYLLGLNERALEVHPDILEKDAEFRAASDRADEQFRGMQPRDNELMEGRFINACGGYAEASHNPCPVKVQKIDTYAKTLALIKDGKNISDIIASRSLTEATILTHLEKLRERDDISPGDIGHLLADRQTLVQDIHIAMRRFGTKPLKPVFDHFNGDISYETLRLARLMFEE